MPITEETMTYEEMKAIIANPQNKCADCGGNLSIAWGGVHGYESYVLRCSVAIDHAGYVKEKKQTMYPGSHVGAIPKKEYKEMEKELGTMTTTKLVPYSTKTALTKSDATDIIETLWGAAPIIEKQKAIALCVTQQLNPLMSHVFLVSYKRRERGQVVGEDWTIMLSIKAKRLMASRRGDYGYLDGTPRAATEDEVKKQFAEDAETILKANLVSVTKLQDTNRMEAQGFGLWPKDDDPKGMNKGNTKRNMANIRSESQALDRLRPGDMPQNVGIIDAEYEVLPNAPDADKDTGEIAEDSPETDAIPEPTEETTEQPATNAITDKEVDDLKVALADYGKEKHHIGVRKDALAKVLQDVGLFVKAQEWQVKNLKDLNREQLRTLHEALNDGKI